VKVKICGITNKEDALCCCQLGADALGFIFHQESIRYIDYASAAEIIASLPSSVLSIGVFVNHTASQINMISNIIGLNRVQIYNNNPRFVEELNKPAICAFRIYQDFDFTLVREIDHSQILFDSFSDSSYGGEGRTFDWTLIPDNLKNKIILAGGVSAINIDFIFNKIHPAGVDLSSSVESSPGKKDHVKLETFFNRLNRLRNEC